MKRKLSKITDMAAKSMLRRLVREGKGYVFNFRPESPSRPGRRVPFGRGGVSVVLVKGKNNKFFGGIGVCSMEDTWSNKRIVQTAMYRAKLAEVVPLEHHGKNMFVVDPDMHIDEIVKAKASTTWNRVSSQRGWTTSIKEFHPSYTVKALGFHTTVIEMDTAK